MDDMTDRSPYASPESIRPVTDRERFGPATFNGDRMQYMYGYQFVFESSNWMLNVLCGTLCVLIPIVGPIVFIGYQYEVIESLHRWPQQIYPDFAFERFVDYLKRGVWPFLVSLVASLVLAPVMIVLELGMFAIFMAASAVDESMAVVVIVLGMLAFWLVMLAISMLFGLAITPMLLRAGLAQDFATAFDIAFVKDFIRRMWADMLWIFLFLTATNMILTLAGFALFCIGVYFVMPLVWLAQAQLTYQLYEIYLARGGEPIPLKEPEVIVATPVQ